MGVISARIDEIIGKYEHCLKVSERIDTSFLEREMQSFVLRCFEMLKPLSYKAKFIGCKDDYKVYLDKWVMVKDENHKRAASVWDAEFFFGIIRELGEQMKPFVRKAIAEDFSKLVDFTKELISFGENVFKVEFPKMRVCRYFREYGVEIKYEDVVAVGVNTLTPYYILIYKAEGGKFVEFLDHVSSLLIMDDLIDYVVKAYDMAEEGIKNVLDHNKKIMGKMNELLKAYEVAREAHR